MEIGIVILILIVILVYVFIQYNSLVKSNNLVKEAFSTRDLVPNLVESVKGYAEYEKEIFSEITKLRTNSYDAMTTNNKINMNEQLTQEISKIMAISENYPELKASSNFSQLSKELTKIEDDIANSRKYYNGTVRILNNQIQMFPSNIIAKIFGFKQANMFEAKLEEKNNVNVEL